MPLALDVVGVDGSHHSPAELRLATAPSVAPADVIPAQSGRFLTISLTDGCEGPMDALRSASPNRAVRCHPCDEAIVLLMLARARLATDNLLVSASISPGTLRVG